MRVDLVDVNDNRPAFYPVSYAVSLSTQSAPGTSVVRVTAYDPDSGENGRITFKTVSGGGSPYFTLNKDTGWYFTFSSAYIFVSDVNKAPCKPAPHVREFVPQASSRFLAPSTGRPTPSYPW